MARWLKTVLQYGIGLGLGVGLLYLVFRKQDWGTVQRQISELNWIWLGIGAAIMLLAHFLRAARWQMLLRAAGANVGVPSLFQIVMAGYLANYGLPRLGEALRCTLLFRNHDVPVAKSAGTVVSDRATDALTLLLLLLILFGLEAQLVTQLVGNSSISKIQNLGWLLAAALLFLVVCIWLVVRFRNQLTKIPVIGVVVRFGLSLLHAAASIRYLKSPSAFLISTIGIWVCYWLSTWAILQGSPSTSATANLYFSLVLTLLGAVGTALPTPGGIGSFHAAIVLGYLALGYTESDGAWAGFLLHTWQLVVNAGVGFMCLILALRISKTPAKL